MRKIKNANQAHATLRQPNRFMMLTNLETGEHYTLDNGATVPKKIARSLQGDLFVKPSGDGLFPDCSQTFKVDVP